MPRRVDKQRGVANTESSTTAALSGPSGVSLHEDQNERGTNTVTPPTVESAQSAAASAVGLAAVVRDTLIPGADSVRAADKQQQPQHTGTSSTSETVTAQNLRDVFAQVIHPNASLWVTMNNGGPIGRDSPAGCANAAHTLAVRYTPMSSGTPSAAEGDDARSALSSPSIVFARGWLVEASQRRTREGDLVGSKFRVIVPHCAPLQACGFQHYYWCEGSDGRVDAQTILLPATLHPSVSSLAVTEGDAVVVVLVPASSAVCIIGLDFMGQETGLTADVFNAYYARPLDEARCDDKLVDTANAGEVSSIVSGGWLRPRIGLPWNSRTPSALAQLLTGIRGRAQAHARGSDTQDAESKGSDLAPIDRIAVLQRWSISALLQPNFTCLVQDLTPQSAGEGGNICEEVLGVSWKSVTVSNTPGIPLLSNLTPSSASAMVDLHFAPSASWFTIRDDCTEPSSRSDSSSDDAETSTPKAGAALFFHPSQTIGLSVPTSHYINWLRLLSLDRTFSSEVIRVGSKRARDDAADLAESSEVQAGFELTVLKVVWSVLQACGSLSGVVDVVSSQIALEVCRSHFFVNVVSTILAKPQLSQTAVEMCESFVTCLLRVLFNYVVSTPTHHWLADTPDELTDDDRPRQPKTHVESIRVCLSAVGHFLSLLFTKQQQVESTLRSEIADSTTKGVIAAFAVKYRNWLELYVRSHQVSEVYKEQLNQHTSALGLGSKQGGSSSQSSGMQGSLVCELATMPMSTLLSVPSLSDLHRIYFPETVALMLEEHEEHVLRAESGAGDCEGDATQPPQKFRGVNTTSIATRSLQLHPTNFYNYQHALLAAVTSHPLYIDDDDSLGNMNDTMFLASLQPPTESAATGSLFLSAAKNQFSTGSKYGEGGDVSSSGFDANTAPTQVSANPSDVHFGFASPLVGGGSNALLFDWWVQRKLLRERREWIATEQRRQHMVAVEKVNSSRRGRHRNSSRRSLLLSSTKHCRYLPVPTSLQPRALLHKHQWMKDLLVELGIVSPTTLLATNTISEELHKQAQHMQQASSSRRAATKFDAAALLRRFATADRTTDMTHAAPDLALRTLTHFLRAEEGRLRRKINRAEKRAERRARELEETGTPLAAEDGGSLTDSSGNDGSDSSSDSHNFGDEDAADCSDEDGAGELTMPELPPSQLFLPIGASMVETAQDAVLYLWKGVLGIRRRLFFGFDHAMGPFACRRRTGAGASEASSAMWLREERDAMSGETRFIPFFEESALTANNGTSSIPHPLSLNCGDVSSATARFVAAVQEERTQHYLNYTHAVGNGLVPLPTLPSLGQVISGLASTNSAANAFSQFRGVTICGPMRPSSDFPLTPLMVECNQMLGMPLCVPVVHLTLQQREGTTDEATLQSAIAPILIPGLSNTTHSFSTKTGSPSRTTYSDSRLLMFWGVVHWQPNGRFMWVHPLQNSEDLRDLCALAVAAQPAALSVDGSATPEFVSLDLPSLLVPSSCDHNGSERVWTLLGALNTQQTIRVVHFTSGLVTSSIQTCKAVGVDEGVSSRGESFLAPHHFRLAMLQAVSPLLASLEVKRLMAEFAPATPLTPANVAIPPLVDVLFSSRAPSSSPNYLHHAPPQQANSKIYRSALTLTNRAEFGPLCWNGVTALVGMSKLDLTNGTLPLSVEAQWDVLGSSHKVFIGALESPMDYKRATYQLLQVLTAGSSLFQHPNSQSTLPTLLNNTRLLEGLPGSGRTTLLANFAAACLFGDTSVSTSLRSHMQAPHIGAMNKERTLLTHLATEDTRVKGADISSRSAHSKALETALVHFQHGCSAQHALLLVHQLDATPYEPTDDANASAEPPLRTLPVICIESASSALRGCVSALTGGSTSDSDAPFSGSVQQLLEVGLDRAAKTPFLVSPLRTAATNQRKDKSAAHLGAIFNYLAPASLASLDLAHREQVVPIGKVASLLLSLLPPTLAAELRSQTSGGRPEEALMDMFPGVCGVLMRCPDLAPMLGVSNPGTSNTGADNARANTTSTDRIVAAAAGLVGQTDVIAKLLYREALIAAAQYAAKLEVPEGPIHSEDVIPPTPVTPDPEEGLHCRVDVAWVVSSAPQAMSRGCSHPFGGTESIWGPLADARKLREELIDFDNQLSRADGGGALSLASPMGVYGTDISPTNFVGAALAPVVHSTLGTVLCAPSIPCEEPSRASLVAAVQRAVAFDAEDVTAPEPRRSRSIFTLSAGELGAMEEELLGLVRYVVAKELLATHGIEWSRQPLSVCPPSLMKTLARHHFYNRSKAVGAADGARITIRPTQVDPKAPSDADVLRPVTCTLFVQSHQLPAFGQFLSFVTTGYSACCPFQTPPCPPPGPSSACLVTALFNRTSREPCAVLADDADTFHVNSFLSMPTPTVMSVSSHPAQHMHSIPQADSSLRRSLSNMLSANHKPAAAPTSSKSLISTYDSTPSASVAPLWQHSFSEEEVIVLKEAQAMVKSSELAIREVGRILVGAAADSISATPPVSEPSVVASRRDVRLESWKDRRAILQLANRSALLLRYALRKVYYHGVLQGPRTIGNRDVFASSDAKIPLIVSQPPSTQSAAFSGLHRLYTHTFQPSRGFHAVVIDMMCTALPTAKPRPPARASSTLPPPVAVPFLSDAYQASSGLNLVSSILAHVSLRSLRPALLMTGGPGGLSTVPLAYPSLSIYEGFENPNTPSVLSTRNASISNNFCQRRVLVNARLMVSGSVAPPTTTTAPLPAAVPASGPPTLNKLQVFATEAASTILEHSRAVRAQVSEELGLGAAPVRDDVFLALQRALRHFIEVRIQQSSRRGSKRDAVLKLGRALLCSFLQTNGSSGLAPLLGTIAAPNRGNGKAFANTSHADGVSRSGTYPFPGYITNIDTILHGLGSAIRNGRPNNGYVLKHGGGSTGVPFREVAPSPFIEQLERKLLSIKLFRDQYKPLFVRARGSAASGSTCVPFGADATPEALLAYRDIADFFAHQDAHYHLHAYFRNGTHLLGALSASSPNATSAGVSNSLHHALHQQQQHDDPDSLFGLAKVSVRVGSNRGDKRTVVSSGALRTVGGIAPAAPTRGTLTSGTDETSAINVLDRRRQQQRALLKAATADAMQRRSAALSDSNRAVAAQGSFSTGFEDDDNPDGLVGDGGVTSLAEQEEQAAPPSTTTNVVPPRICEAMRSSFGVCGDVGGCAPWSYHLCTLLLDTIEDMGDDIWAPQNDTAALSEMDLAMHQFDSSVLLWNCPWSATGKSGLALQTPEAMLRQQHANPSASRYLREERRLQEILSGAELAIVCEVLPALLLQKMRKWRDTTEALSNLVANVRAAAATDSQPVRSDDGTPCTQQALGRFLATEVVNALLGACVPLGAISPCPAAGDAVDILVARAPTAGGSVMISVGLRPRGSLGTGDLLDRLACYLDDVDGVENQTNHDAGCCQGGSTDRGRFTTMEPVLFVRDRCEPGTWMGTSVGLVVVSLDERMGSSMSTLQALHTAHGVLHGGRHGSQAATTHGANEGPNSAFAEKETDADEDMFSSRLAEEDEAEQARAHEAILLGSIASRPRESAQTEISQLDFDVQSEQMKAARVICTYTKLVDPYAVAAAYNRHQHYLFSLQAWLRIATSCALKGVMVVNGMPTDKPPRIQVSMLGQLSDNERMKVSLGDVAATFSHGGNPLLLAASLSLPPVALLGHQCRFSALAASSSIVTASKLLGTGGVTRCPPVSVLSHELLRGFVLHEESHFDAYINYMNRFQLKLESLTKRRQVLLEQQQRMRGRNQLQRQSDEEEDDGTWTGLTASAARTLFEMALKYRSRNPNSKHGLALSSQYLSGVPRVPFAIPRVVMLRDLCPSPAASTYVPIVNDFALCVRWLLFEASGEKLPPANGAPPKPGMSFPSKTVRIASARSYNNEGGGLSVMRIPDDLTEPPSRSLLADTSMAASIRAAASVHMLCVDSLATIIDAAQPEEDITNDDDPAAVAASAVHHNANRNVSSAISSLIAAAASGKLVPATARYQQGGEDVSQGLLKLAKELRAVCDTQFHLHPFNSLQSIYPSAPHKVDFSDLQSRLSDSSVVTSLAVRLSHLSASPLIVYSEGQAVMGSTYFPLKSDDEPPPATSSLHSSNNNNTMHQRWWLMCLSGSQVIPPSLVSKKGGASEQLASLYLAGLVGSLLVEGLAATIMFPCLPMSCPRHRRTKFALTQQTSSQASRQAPVTSSLLFGSEAVLNNSGSLLRYFRRAGAGACDMVCLGRFDGCSAKAHLCLASCHPVMDPAVPDECTVANLSAPHPATHHSMCPFPCERKQAKCDHQCSKPCGVKPCPASCPRKLVAERACGQWVVSSYTREPQNIGQIVLDSHTRRKTITTKDGIVFEFFPHYMTTECGTMAAVNEGRIHNLNPCEEPVTVCCKRCSNEIVMRVRCRDVSALSELLEDADAPHAVTIQACPHCAKIEDTLRARARELVSKGELQADMVRVFMTEKLPGAVALERKKAVLRLQAKGLQAASNADSGSLVNADYRQQTERLEKWERVREELEAEGTAAQQAIKMKWMGEFKQRLAFQNSKADELDLKNRLLKDDVSAEVEQSKLQIRGFRDAVLTSVSNLLKQQGQTNNVNNGNDNLRWNAANRRR